jgi:N-acetylgalactosamine kinase
MRLCQLLLPKKKGFFTSMAKPSIDLSIILAAGKGSRMGSTERHKVCFPVDGEPAICRALACYERCGIPRHLVVVGTMAQQVMETIAARQANVSFAFQTQANGTAAAVKAALAADPSLPDSARVLLAAGDRMLAPSVAEALIELFDRGRCDIAILASPTRADSGAGRIVLDAEDDALAVLEMADIRQQRTYAALREQATTVKSFSTAAIRALLASFFDSDNAEKLAKAFPTLWPALDAQSELSSAELLAMLPEEAGRFSLPTRHGQPLCLTPDDAEALPHSNTSVYITTKAVLANAMAKLSTDNAQQEEYLSDLVAITTAAGGRAKVLLAENPGDVLGFNNPAELLEVETALRSRQQSARHSLLPDEEFRPLGDWLALFADPSRQEQLQQCLESVYGANPETISRQQALYLPLLQFVRNTLGEQAEAERLAIVRAPGRLNVMGRHVDHQGGHCNLMTISYETLMAIRPRTDDLVRLFNLDDTNYRPSEFRLSKLVAELPWTDWHSLVASDQLKKLVGQYGVDWSHYIQAAFLRLQKHYPQRLLRGVDIFVSGNIPPAAGLSSSSSLVVGAASAAVRINGLDCRPAELVSLCGEGEWYVGTRGGSADHAAVMLGQRDAVVKVKFFDFGVEDLVPFPADLSMLVCDSGLKACKALGAKDQFNHRIACYRLAFRIICRQFPQYRHLLQHLRDVNARHLGVPPAWIYRILLCLPEQASRSELAKLLPGEDLSETWAGHQGLDENTCYPLRGVTMFGLAEAERSRAYADLLKQGDVDEIGRLMRCSHDGDRVVSFDQNGVARPYSSPVDNSSILQLMDDLGSGEPERVLAAQLRYQPGAYACSLEAIDEMVDIAQTVPGVYGAQLAGAGLGGCMMILAQRDAVDAVRQVMRARYYEPRQLPASILVCHPIAGAGLFPGPRQAQA